MTRTGKAMLKLAPNKTEAELQEVYDHLQYAVYGQDNKLNVTGDELTADLHAGEKRRRAWETQTAAADRHNTPGEFTALIGWEWSSNYRGANLTVDLATATYDNSIGAESLTAAWKDPDFDPRQRAFYYVRALEIPTPRYSLYDAIALGIDVADTGRPATIQERVYSSPIWYTPEL